MSKICCCLPKKEEPPFTPLTSSDELMSEPAEAPPEATGNSKADVVAPVSPDVGVRQVSAAQGSAEPSPSLSPADLALLSADQLLNRIKDPVYAAHAPSIELCLKQLRVLCRDDRTCDQCDKGGANDTIVAIMHDHAQSVTVLIQSCAVLINLCAGDSFERRDHAAMAGALPAIADAMRKHIGSPILQEMSFVALQNICFGNDSNGASISSAPTRALPPQPPSPTAPAYFPPNLSTSFVRAASRSSMFTPIFPSRKGEHLVHPPSPPCLALFWLVLPIIHSLPRPRPSPPLLALTPRALLYSCPRPLIPPSSILRATHSTRLPCRCGPESESS